MAAPALGFPEYAQPQVSLIIPVHSQADLTAACLRSIVRATERPTYEVVLVDDTADEDTKHLLRSVENAVPGKAELRAACMRVRPAPQPAGCCGVGHRFALGACG